MSSTMLLAVVEQVCSADLSGVEVPGIQGDALAVQHAIGRLSGWLDVLLGEVEARGGAVDAVGEPVATQVWWRDAATVSGQEAGRDIRRANVLRELPLLRAAVTSGELSPGQGEVLCRLHGNIPKQDLLDSQADLVRVAAGMNTEALGRWVRHLIARHSEAALEREEASARERRYLQLRRDNDGTVRGSFRIPEEDAEVLLTVLEPLARPVDGHDERSAGQRRADALVDVFTGAAAWMDLPVAGGQRPQVTYVLDAAWAARLCPPSLPQTLAGQGLPGWARSAHLSTAHLSTDDSGTAGPGTAGPVHPNRLEEHSGSGAWTGPQTRARIEAVLCDARISRLLLDLDGTIRSLVSLTDQITPAQRRAVSARDRHCVAKGCHRPPAFCDVHHLIHRADGGPTEVGNLVLLCRRHHVAWHRGSLHLHQLHTPWLDPPDEDLWDGHAPPLIA